MPGSFPPIPCISNCGGLANAVFQECIGISPGPDSYTVRTDYECPSGHHFSREHAEYNGTDMIGRKWRIVDEVPQDIPDTH